MGVIKAYVVNGEWNIFDHPNTGRKDERLSVAVDQRNGLLTPFQDLCIGRNGIFDNHDVAGKTVTDVLDLKDANILWGELDRHDFTDTHNVGRVDKRPDAQTIDVFTRICCDHKPQGLTHR